MLKSRKSLICLRLHLSFVGLQLVSGLGDHVLADRADVIVIDGVVVLLPDAVDAVAGGLAMMIEYRPLTGVCTITVRIP